MNVSVVVPSYNAAQWLPKTLAKLANSLKAAKIVKFEIIIVDDGSSDNTEGVVDKLPKSYKVTLITQKNQGRYIARKTGIAAAKYDNILLIDTRVFIDKNSLKYVTEQLKKSPNKKVWNSHVNVEKKGNIFARFWDAIAQIAWRRYFSNPRDVSYGIKDFDHYPKGTTCFFAPKTILKKAMEKYESSVDKVTKTSNDDTLIIREIAKKNRINISPKFSCLYHARADAKQFTRHVYHRGQVFSDGFLRPGNRFFIPLIVFHILTVLLVLVAIFKTSSLLPIALLGIIVWLIGLLVSLILLKEKEDALSLWLLSPLFVIFYGAGIWRKSSTVICRSPYFWAFILYLTALMVYAHGLVGGLDSRLLNGPSDATSLIGLNLLSSDSPWWGYTHSTNYPVGEDLWQPTFIIGQLFYIPYWVAAKLFGAVAGYNLLVGFGFLFSSLITFAFLRWLLKKDSFIAPLFGGFGLAFTPYLLVKAPSHPTYVFCGLLVLLLWFLLIYFKKPTKLIAGLIGCLLASFFYFDPYFPLLGGIILLSFSLALTIYSKFKILDLARDHLKNIIIFAGGFSALFIPLLVFYSLNKNKITTFVSDSRGDILGDAHAFSARPWEFFLPAYNGTFTPDRIKEFEKFHLHGSNPTENTLYIGLIVAFFAFVGLVVLWKKRVKSLSINFKFLKIFLSVLIGTAFLFSLPPYFYVFGIKFHGPSYLVISLTDTWRVFSRLVLVIQLGTVILSSIGLWYCLDKVRSNIKKYALVGAIFTLLFIEFAVSLPVWNLKAAQPVYENIKNDSSVNAIAEYPLLDPPQDVYFTLYAAYQQLHDKPVINSVVANSNNELFRDSLANLTLWQTVPVLKSMGVDTVIVHGPYTVTKPGAMAGLTFVDESYDNITLDQAWRYTIHTVAPEVDCILEIGQGFDGPSTTSFNNAQYYTHQASTLSIKDIPGNKEECAGNKKVRLEFYTFEKNMRPFSIKQNGNIVWSGHTLGYGQKQQVEFTGNAAYPLELYPETPPEGFSLVISNMIANN